MKKLNKIFSILLTAAIMTSMLVTGAIPVGAADNAWGSFSTPSATNEVLANDYVDSGLLTMAIDGTLFAYVNTAHSSDTHKLAKSTNGGRTWTIVTVPGKINALFCSPSEANVLYFAVGNELFKSTDSGATFATRGTVAAGETITAIGAAIAGGSYKIMIGTASLLGGNTYYQNEGDFFLSFTAFGNLGAVAPAGANVLALKLSPNFATDQGIIALVSNGVTTEVHFSTAGGVFGASLKKAAIPLAAPVTAAIDFPTEFAMPASTIFFVGVGNGAGAGGIYRIVAAAASSATASTATVVGGVNDIVSLDVSGSYAGTGTIFAGTATGGVLKSSDSGANFTAAGKLTGTSRTFVVMAGDYATSGKVYALQAAAVSNDESGFAISTDMGARFNQVSLLNSNNAFVEDVAVASNGDVYMLTRNGVVGGLGDRFTLTATAAGAVATVAGTAVLGTAITETGAVATTIVGGVVTFGDVGDKVEFTCTTAGTVTLTAAAGVTFAETYDSNNSQYGGISATGKTFNTDLNLATSNSLWRYMGGNWERVQTMALGAMKNIEVSPNYATDKAVFFVGPTNLINYSVNNGHTFSAQASASAGAIVDYEVIDLQTFVVANGTDIIRTTNNGFIWTTVSTADATMLVRSSDGTALAAYAGGAITRSTDLGATWSTATTSTLAGVTALAFQNGSNNVLWATTGAGVFSIDLSATTVAWSARKDIGAGAAAIFDSPATANTMTAAGVGIVSMPGPGAVVYAMDAAGVLTRILGDASLAGTVAPGTGFSSAQALFASGTSLLVLGDNNELHMFTDQLAVAVGGVAIGSFTTTTAVVNWTAVAGADRYAVSVKAGSTAGKDAYTAAFGAGANSVTGTTFTLTGLTADTTYTVSVWAVRTSASGNAARVSFAGFKTFSTQPTVPPPPVGLAPAPAATGIPTMPSFQWGAIAGATSYELELSTSPTFSPLTGTKITATIPAAAWTGTALANNTVYYWRVRAITATGTSDWVVSTFTTVAATPTSPPVTIPTSPVVTPTVTVVIPDTETPTYIWAIIGVGALLTVLVIVLIVRTRRVV
ncbi:hypothetical protein [Dehalogenimonas alkenigignens]|uniref:hypothetical protein n=1 Tax=Dehalogenimonas alkenigignens TaxID=1217799 RepID=UPI000D565FEB|nr:hypothetical protein [Dehalogenimonas alkenigignens]PVV82890.1 hypothetical protein DD509_07830 [Dehalogenimonas alkenigignens]